MKDLRFDNIIDELIFPMQLYFYNLYLIFTANIK